MKRVEDCIRRLLKKTPEIKAIRFREGGFASQPFAFGGEEGPEKFDFSVKYRSGLTNYLIDTGDEVILVDTGLPEGTPEESPDEKTAIYTGHDIKGYMEALGDLGYGPGDISKILLTHKHLDHSGLLSRFPNARIFVNEEECDAAELQGLPNLVPVKFTDGAYYNFPACQKIRDGVYFIRAKGHTKGNSIVIAESDGLFYMLHGDITYTDEALYENKLSVVFEDLAAARETLDRVREFVAHHPTVYLSTHTPSGPENLEGKRIVDLNNPPETIPAGEVVFRTASGKYVCSVCGYVYIPAEHDNVAFEDLPDDWRCPRCRQPRERFNRA
ncbi:MAG: MBL fold metallo-hydrolase [Oscillospiraceae bacterium]|nr:MBL fold metallo-hydrolase [Oscillospiraceae bacterium]